MDYSNEVICRSRAEQEDFAKWLKQKGVDCEIAAVTRQFQFHHSIKLPPDLRVFTKDAAHQYIQYLKELHSKNKTW